MCNLKTFNKAIKLLLWLECFLNCMEGLVIAMATGLSSTYSEVMVSAKLQSRINLVITFLVQCSSGKQTQMQVNFSLLDVCACGDHCT